MNCWYIYGEDCERHGICEGCQKYEDWRKQRDKIQLLNELKMKAEKQHQGYLPNLIPESIWVSDFKRWKEEKNNSKDKGDINMIDMKGIETRVMINYLHHNGIEVECLRPDQIEDEYGIDCDEFKGDDLNSKRADYDLALAKFLDGFEDGDLIHEKEGFDEVFTKATDINVPRDNDEEFYAYDALFRDRELRYSFANGKWRLWFSGYDPYTGTQILFRVLKANIIEPLVIDGEEIMGRELSIRIRGRIAEQIKGDGNE